MKQIMNRVSIHFNETQDCASATLYIFPSSWCRGLFSRFPKTKVYLKTNI